MGIPIGLGYFAVSFTLGISAGNAGMTAVQAMLTSLLVNASAGQYAGFTVIAANSGYMEMVVMELIANARYLLMSCALSQKLGEETGLLHRLLIGFDVTDEIFGVAVSVPEKLNPYYNYGMMTVAIPGWSLGTLFGVVMGNILPSSVVSALSVALYGMFIAIIIPASKANRVVGGVVAASFLISFTVSKIPLFDHMSDSMKISLLTVIIAGVAAYLFPAKDEEEGEECIADAPDTTKEVR